MEYGLLGRLARERRTPERCSNAGPTNPGKRRVEAELHEQFDLLYRVALRLTRSTQEAEDLCREVVLRGVGATDLHQVLRCGLF